MPRRQNNELNSQTSIQISRLLSHARGGVAVARNLKVSHFFVQTDFEANFEKHNRIRNRNEASKYDN